MTTVDAESSVNEPVIFNVPGLPKSSPTSMIPPLLTTSPSNIPEPPSSEPFRVSTAPPGENVPLSTINLEPALLFKTAVIVLVRAPPDFLSLPKLSSVPAPSEFEIFASD